MRSQIFLFLILITTLTGCKDKQAGMEVAEEVVPNEIEDKLLGKINKDELMKPVFAEWFQPAYEDYQVNSELVESYKDQLKEYEIEVFMGTWCEDSQREIPTLYKILEAADYPMEQLTIIAIDDEIENYKRSPGGEEEGRHIHHVPTIILKNKGEEINRIIEYPVRTLEEDLQLIFDGGYTPYYFAADMVHARLNEMGLENFKADLDKLAVEFTGKTRDVYELNTYAKTIFRQGKKEEGIQVATLNTMIYPDNPNAYAGLGSRYMDMEQYEEAAKYFGKAVAMAPDDSEFKGYLEEAQAKL